MFNQRDDEHVPDLPDDFPADFRQKENMPMSHEFFDDDCHPKFVWNDASQSEPEGNDPLGCSDGLITDDLISDELIENDAWLEMQTQLHTDAQHLAETYPPLSSSRRQDLIERCQLARDRSASSAATRESMETVSARHTPWLPLSLSICLGLIVCGTVAWLENRPSYQRDEQPAVAKQLPVEFSRELPVAREQVPRAFLDASQPELEAIYDQNDHMRLVTTSFEF